MKSFYKTVSWLVVSGILIAGCGYFETGSLKVAVMSAFWACILKTPIYWIHVNKHYKHNRFNCTISH